MVDEDMDEPGPESPAPETLASEGLSAMAEPDAPRPTSDARSIEPLLVEPPRREVEPPPMVPESVAEELAVAATERRPDFEAITKHFEPEPASPAEVPLAIQKLSPASGALVGGTRVVIEGTGFVEGCEVRIADVPAPAELESSTRLVCTSLARNVAGKVDVKVVNPDETWTIVILGFEYCEPPTLTGITPRRAPVAGAVRAALSGSGLRRDCEVRIGAARPLVHFVSAARVDLEIPAHPAGAYDVELANPDGQSARLDSAFEFEAPPEAAAAEPEPPVGDAAPPRVEKLEPARGPLGRPTRVAVLGAGFANGARVTANGRGLAVRFVAPERLEVELSAAEPGLVDVEVKNPDGQAHGLRAAFEFRGSPRLASVDPRQGGGAGNLIATLVGDGFDRGCAVLFGESSARCEWRSETCLRVTVPASLGAGSVNVVVTNPDAQSATLERGFTYTARVKPGVERLEPTSGATTGGTAVLVVGSHLDTVTQVLVDGAAALGFKTKGAGELAFLTPPRASEGVVDVELRARDGARVVQKNAFQYRAVPPPVIRSVSPNRGAVSGGTAVTISGEHFAAGSSVLVDGKAVPAAKVRDASAIEFVTPPGESGRMVDVAVRSPTGQQSVAKRAFLYDPRSR